MDKYYLAKRNDNNKFTLFGYFSQISKENFTEFIVFFDLKYRYESKLIFFISYLQKTWLFDCCKVNTRF